MTHGAAGWLSNPSSKIPDIAISAVSQPLTSSLLIRELSYRISPSSQLVRLFSSLVALNTLSVETKGFKKTTWFASLKSVFGQRAGSCVTFLLSFSFPFFLCQHGESDAKTAALSKTLAQCKKNLQYPVDYECISGIKPYELRGFYMSQSSVPYILIFRIYWTTQKCCHVWKFWWKTGCIQYQIVLVNLSEPCLFRLYFFRVW